MDTLQDIWEGFLKRTCRSITRSLTALGRGTAGTHPPSFLHPTASPTHLAGDAKKVSWVRAEGLVFSDWGAPTGSSPAHKPCLRTSRVP